MTTRIPNKLTPERVADLYFMQHRAAVLDIAAFLDRYDRAEAQHGAASDFRVAELRRALALLTDGGPQRARRVLELFSDPSGDPIDQADGKGACGAWRGSGEQP